MPSCGLTGMMEEIESMIAHARQSLLAGPAGTGHQHFDFHHSFVTLGAAVERLQRRTMSAETARHCAKTLTVVQDFVDTCLRSPSLGESENGVDLSPLLYVLLMLVSVEAVPTRFLPASEAAAAAAGFHHINRDHGKPLLRQFHGRSRRVWADDARGAR